MKKKEEDDTSTAVAVIVAHPDDETLWAGGTLLNHPLWDCFIISLCRGKDLDRAPKFLTVVEQLKAKGEMGDLDDGPDQRPLPEKEIEQTILTLLPSRKYDLIITHNPNGEYTRHLRHEETSKAVIRLWKRGDISTKSLWTFAYEDGQGKYLPKARLSAPLHFKLLSATWQLKHALITDTYGFAQESWEAKTTPKEEAFWVFNAAFEAEKWLNKGGVLK